MTLQPHNPGLALQEPRMPVLRTERLVLRAPRLDDAEAIAALINDRRIAENTARIPHPYAREDAEQFIASAQTSGELSFLVARPDDTIIGGCGVGSLRADGPEIGYWLGFPHWGQGYATEAARAVIDHAFAALARDDLRGGARVSNPASRRVLEKCGFEWTGVVLQRVRSLGSSVPCDRFLLRRDRWEALKNSGRIDRAA